MILNSSNPPTLYVIATPIGNLEDITLRAIKILKAVDVLFAEDTRSASVLLNSLGIVKKTVSLHSYNEKGRIPQIIGYLSSMKNVGLISECGTPCISDPGNLLIKNVIDEGFRVEVIPGPTAFIPALILSGYNISPFIFLGFLPSTPKMRRRLLRKLEVNPFTIVCYESPHRIIGSLKDTLNILGDRKISLSRELTKIYEETLRGTISQIIAELENNPRKGEMVLVITPKSGEKA